MFVCIHEKTKIAHKVTAKIEIANKGMDKCLELMEVQHPEVQHPEEYVRHSNIVACCMVKSKHSENVDHIGK